MPSIHTGPAPAPAIILDRGLWYRNVAHLKVELIYWWAIRPGKIVSGLSSQRLGLSRPVHCGTNYPTNKPNNQPTTNEPTGGGGEGAGAAGAEEAERASAGCGSGSRAGRAGNAAPPGRATARAARGRASARGRLCRASGRGKGGGGRGEGAPTRRLTGCWVR
jgi:hypothetical protein